MRFFTAAAFLISASVAFADQAKPTISDVIASCNVQMGQTLSSLGQAQQQIVSLQSQLADAEKQIADFKSAKVPKKGEGK